MVKSKEHLYRFLSDDRSFVNYKEALSFIREAGRSVDNLGLSLPRPHVLILITLIPLAMLSSRAAAFQPETPENTNRVHLPLIARNYQKADLPLIKPDLSVIVFSACEGDSRLEGARITVFPGIGGNPIASGVSNKEGKIDFDLPEWIRRADVQAELPQYLPCPDFPPFADDVPIPSQVEFRGFPTKP